MPIPDYETIMLPLLKFAIDGKEYSSKETVHVVAESNNKRFCHLLYLKEEGNLYYNKEDYEESLMYYEKSLEIKRE